MLASMVYPTEAEILAAPSCVKEADNEQIAREFADRLKFEKKSLTKTTKEYFYDANIQIILKKNIETYRITSDLILKYSFNSDNEYYVIDKKSDLKKYIMKTFGYCH